MKYYILIIFILLAGAVIRLYNLGANPSILNRDEAALAYNAYLLHETGIDEWGRTFPLALESFGDYKLLGYPLTLVALFNILPANDFAVRLPSAISGILLIALTFLIAKRVFNSKKTVIFFLTSIALTPVFIFYSRVAYEANLALLLFLTGIFILIIDTNYSILKQLLAYTCITFACITYNTPLILLPTLLPVFILWKGVKNYKYWLPHVLFISFLFIFLYVQLAPVTAQKSEVSIFKNNQLNLDANDYYNSLPTAFRLILGNKYIFYSKEICMNFFQSFSYIFLVVKGGTHPWHTLPNWGNIYVVSYVLAIIGIFFSIFTLLKKLPIFLNKNKYNFKKYVEYIMEFKYEILFLYLLIVSLIPSIITIDSPHTTRSLFFIYFLILFSAYGMQYIFEKYTKFSFFSLLFSVLVMLSASSMYLVDYFFHYPKVQPLLYQSNYKNVVVTTLMNNSNVDIAVVDPEGYHYIITAWYMMLEPKQFFSTIIKQQPNTIAFRYGERVANIHFIAKKEDYIKSGEKVIVFMESNGNWVVENL